MIEPCKLIQISEQHYQINISSENDPYLSKEKLEILSELCKKVNNMNNIKIIEFIGNNDYFSAGGSADFLTTLSAKNMPQLLSELPELILKFKPVTISRMFGHALGGGLSIGLWADLPCLSESSLYGANFMALGFTPGMGASIALQDYFGKPLADEMLLTGKLYRGKDLKTTGCPIATRIYPKNDYESMINSLIASLLEIDYKPLILFKETLAKRRLKILKEQIPDEVHMHTICFSDNNILTDIPNKYLGKETDHS